MKEPLTSISIFSGAMGLDIGLEKAGFQTKLAIEKWMPAVSTIRFNRPNIPIIPKPIENVTSKEILLASGISKGEITLLAGGPSCQSFSTVGKRGSISDDRGKLFKDYCRVIKDIRPRFFIMENVPGMLSAAIKHRPLKERGPGFPEISKEEELGSAFQRILNEFSNLGYYIIFGVINSADYGVPQKRKRLIFLGSRDGEDIKLPSPTHALDQSNGLKPWINLKTALRGIKAKEWVELPEKTKKYLSALKSGQNWKDLPENWKKKAMGGAYKSWGGRSGFLRRLDWKSPAPSLITSPIGKATMLCHPTSLRPLSVEEYACIQQFPKDYKFKGTTIQNYALIGNAVPVGIGEAIGDSIKRTIEETKKNGFTKANEVRKGTIKCVDQELLKRFKKYKKTILPPIAHRLNKNPDLTKVWLKNGNIKEIRIA
ncbi:DNA cytosine methyltransferase [Leptospira levettii]|uniref:DNA cytosine methyltransferase n=1 Tax=Leptospira levettii TaxID=2023178 RepID=UPI001EEA1C46|nr:DNA cytosine methyltransferase [Leptospira levettii]MCG6147404.1 DNA cytosine methyltransferase [Leptospira levettii]